MSLSDCLWNLDFKMARSYHNVCTHALHQCTHVPYQRTQTDVPMYRGMHQCDVPILAANLAQIASNVHQFGYAGTVHGYIGAVHQCTSLVQWGTLVHHIGYTCLAHGYVGNQRKHTSLVQYGKLCKTRSPQHCSFHIISNFWYMGSVCTSSRGNTKLFIEQEWNQHAQTKAQVKAIIYP